MFFKKDVQYPSKEYPITQQPSLQPNEFQMEQIKRKYGMFLHFGINTFNNTEWSDGTLPVSSYTPSAIDADNWVKTAYEAGMNYVIVITKHHDGFCMWNTDSTEYSIKYSPCKTDVVDEVYKACQKYGVKLGLYYSLWDRHEKCYKKDEEYVCYMEKHLKELMDGRYGEIAELWFDGDWDKPCSAWQLDRLYNLIKQMQPKCQIGVNHTVGKFTNKKGFPPKKYLPENYRENDPLRMFPSDFRLWDPHMCRSDDPKIYTFNGEKYYLPFEMTICSRKKFCWFYSDAYESKSLMEADEIIKNYNTLVNAQNMLVINLPPKYDGRLVDGDVDNIMKIAKKLNIYRAL